MRISRLGFVAAVLVGSCVSSFAAPPEGLPKTPPPVSPSAPPASSQPSSELLYVPLKSCRLASTLSASGGIFQPNSARAFRVRGTASLASQGGSATGCDVPTYATAVAVSATVRGYAQGGYMAVRDPGTSAQTRFISYLPNVYQTTTPVFPLGASEPSLTIYSGAGAGSHLLLDVVGYYTPPIEGMISSGGGLYSGTSRLISAVRNSTGSYTLTVDRDVTYCSVTTQAYSYGYESHAYLFNNTTVSVYVFTRGSGTTTAQDDYVYVKVSC